MPDLGGNPVETGDNVGHERANIKHGQRISGMGARERLHDTMPRVKGVVLPPVPVTVARRDYVATTPAEPPAYALRGTRSEETPELEARQHAAYKSC